ncbi:MAG TPA: hypothetical protein VE988_06025 [Gemmataceae bacterium]|nr:hypothetical protein [Gemmataceae bacterium]
MLLPTVLIHSLYVVRALFKTLEPNFQPHDPLQDFWLMAGYLLWAEAMGDEEDHGFATQTFNEMFEESRLACGHCVAPFEFDAQNINSLWEIGKVTCRACGKECS